MIYELGQANRLGNRNTNQDRFAAIETDEGVLLVLGDGMGGQARGEVAAQILVDTAKRLYMDAERPIRNPKPFLDKVLRTAHQAIIDYGEQQIPPITPGTTGVVCLVQDSKVTWAHVGDSRLYIYQNALPLYRTTDHSLVEMLYQKGEISRREQDSHPQRNQITQCLGGGLVEEPEPTISHTVNMRVEDIILICTDGLWGPMDDSVMGRFLCRQGNLDDIINSMAQEAEQLSYPNSDNISVLALRLLATTGQNKATAETTGESKVSPADDPLQSAIAEIEAVIKKYENEIEK
ncbi:MAG: protein phosphatase 2C domain-containing protein [Chromatiales bacterium]|nr:protein phosphatase 2C domain-containing protein [Chromatiales bacterium]